MLFINNTHSENLLSLMRNILEAVEQLAGVVDIKNIYPAELLRKLRESKFFSVSITTEKGGLGLDIKDLVLLLYEVGKRLPALSLSLFTHLQVLEYLKNVSPQLFEKVSQEVTTKGSIMALAITEPGAGTDIKKIESKLERKNNGYLLRGIKSMVTNGLYADWFLVLCKDPNGDYATCLVPKDKGVEINAVLELSGMRGSGISRVVFDEINIDKEHIIDQGKSVLRNLFYILSLGRLFTASTSLGIAYTGIEEIFRWGTRREILGKKLIEYDNVIQAIGKFASDIEIYWIFINELARNWNSIEGGNKSYLAALIKHSSTRLAKEIIDFAMTLYGSHGYVRGTRIERIYRDVKAFEFIEGSNEALKAYVYKTMLKRFQNNLDLLTYPGGIFCQK